MESCTTGKLGIVPDETRYRYYRNQRWYVTRVTYFARIAWFLKLGRLSTIRTAGGLKMVNGDAVAAGSVMGVFVLVVASVLVRREYYVRALDPYVAKCRRFNTHVAVETLLRLSDLAEDIFAIVYTVSSKNAFIFLAFYSLSLFKNILERFVTEEIIVSSTIRSATVLVMPELVQAYLYMYFCSYSTLSISFYALMATLQIICALYFEHNERGLPRWMDAAAIPAKEYARKEAKRFSVTILGVLFGFCKSSSLLSVFFQTIVTIYIWVFDIILVGNASHDMRSEQMMIMDNDGNFVGKEKEKEMSAMEANPVHGSDGVAPAPQPERLSDAASEPRRLPDDYFGRPKMIYQYYMMINLALLLVIALTCFMIMVVTAFSVVPRFASPLELVTLLYVLLMFAGTVVGFGKVCFGACSVVAEQSRG
jgi:hypothetical protein